MEEHEILAVYALNSEKKVEELRKLMIKQKEELKQFDMSLVLQLDQKVNNLICFLNKYLTP